MHPRRLVTIAVLVAFGLAPAAPAAASQGSVPAEVTDYATDPRGLRAALDDLAGLTADGRGIDFDESTEVGSINRVFAFTADWLAGIDTETPVELQNRWSAPVSVEGALVGLATIWINPGSIAPELATFVPEPAVAGALQDVPAEAYLIYDEPRDA